MHGPPTNRSRRSDPAEDVPTLWDDRYGVGSFQRMLSLLERPCVSFARVASEFGVSRERVRQWQLQYRPGAPTGQQRRQLCREIKARRRMFSDEVFVAFHCKATAQLAEVRLGLLESATGFRARAVRLNRRVVALCDGRHLSSPSMGRAHDVWLLNAPDAEFFFVLLDGDQFLFLPRQAAAVSLRGRGLEAHDALLVRYRGNFDGLGEDAHAWPAASGT